MLKTYVTSVVLVIALSLAALTSGRFIQDTSDERDKRQIGDLRAAEYLARITLDKNKMLRYLQLPTHCAELACGLVDVYESIVKRTMSDQRLAELQALIALGKGHDIPVGHGLIDPWRIIMKRVWGDQRIVDIQARMALSRARNTRIGHGMIDFNKIGKRRKRSLDNLLNSDLNKGQRFSLLDLLASNQDEQYS